MKIDTSFDSAFLQLQNGVNNAEKAADSVLASVGGDKKAKLDIPKDNNNDRGQGQGQGGINVSA